MRTHRHEAISAWRHHVLASLGFGLSVLLACKAALAMEMASEATPEGPIEEFSAVYFACQDEARGNRAAMQACMTEELKLQQTLLNQALADLRAQLDGPAARLLDVSQKNWDAYKNSTCSFYRQVNRSAMAPLEEAACRLDTTMERAALLRHWKR